MEEYMTFVETTSPFVLHDLPWRPDEQDIRVMFEKQWGHLRPAVLFCLRHHPGQHTARFLRKTRQHFEKYAFLVEHVRCTHACCAAEY